MVDLTSWCLLCGREPNHAVAVKNLTRNLRKTINGFTKIRSTSKGAPRNVCTNCDIFIRFYEKQKEHYDKVQEMFSFALKKSRKPEELLNLRTKFGVADELQDWKSLELADVKVKLERLDNSLFESFTVNSIDECFLNPETELVVKAEPMSPRPASPETIPFLPQYSPDSDLPDKFDNSPPPSPVLDSESDGLSDHFEVVNSKRKKVLNPNKTTNRTYECDLCGFTICWKSSMGQHMKKQHIVAFNKYKCKKCPKTYKTRPGLTLHFDRKHSKTWIAPSFSCKLCDRGFSTKWSLSIHYAGVHENRRNFQCSICSKMFQCRSSLNQHEETHIKTKKFQCTICPLRTSTLLKLKAHLKRHSQVPCFCDICGAKVASKRVLDSHKKFVHGNVELHTCIVCGKQIKRPKDYKEHLIALHTDLRPYSCPYCNRTFNNGPNYIKHKRESHPEQFVADKKRIDLKSVILPTIEELHARIKAANQ